MRAKLKLRFPIGFMRLAYVSYICLAAAFYILAALLLAVGFPWRPWDPSIQYPSLITLRLAVIGFALSSALTLSELVRVTEIPFFAAMVALCVFTTLRFVIETTVPLRLLQLAFATAGGAVGFQHARSTDVRLAGFVAFSALFVVLGAVWRVTLPFVAIVFGNEWFLSQLLLRIVETMRKRQSYLP